jgi:uncharacterized membrane protein YheB (UPF0754 family)
MFGFLLHEEHLKPIGYYALSGAITNWLAIYMLFEKIPFLYGSGVVPSRFQEFKAAIRNLIMKQFFNQKNIDKFIQSSAESLSIDGEAILESIDFSKVFQGLCDAIMSSQFGSMLNMFGGVEALKPMEESITKKLKSIFNEMISAPDFIDNLQKGLAAPKEDGFQKKVSDLVEARLDELTPRMVKNLVQDMISEHLGWLVVWGGFFGGLMGLGFSFL